MIFISDDWCAQSCGNGQKLETRVDFADLSWIDLSGWQSHIKVFFEGELKRDS